MAFADLPKNRNGPSRRYLGAHIFDRVCNENGIEHKLTKPYHPWTNGQAERMNRAVKEATIKAFHYPDLARVIIYLTQWASNPDVLAVIRSQFVTCGLGPVC
jgi:transposase InsO family protein